MLLDILKNRTVKVIFIFSFLWTFLDSLWDLFLSLLHVLAMLVHYAFELFEHSLDIMVESLFHTGPRATEIIVFYIMAAMACGLVLLILRCLPGWYCIVCEHLRFYCRQQKANAFEFWQSQSAALKAKWYALALTGIFFVYFFVAA